MWVAAAYAELKCPIRSRGVVLAVNAPTGGVHREESRLEGPESRSRRRAKIWRSQYAERGALRRRTRRARADRGRKCRRAAAMSGNSPITFGLSAHVRLTARSWSIDSFVRPIGDSLSHMTSTAPCTRINRPVAAGARAKAPCGVSEHVLHSTCVFRWTACWLSARTQLASSRHVQPTPAGARGRGATTAFAPFIQGPF